MMETEKFAWENGDDVFLVIDVIETRDMLVDIVCEGLVANLQGKRDEASGGRLGNNQRRTRGIPYPTVLNVVPGGKWSGRNTESSSASAAPVRREREVSGIFNAEGRKGEPREWPTIVTWVVLCVDMAD